MDMSRVSTCTIPMHDREIAYALQVVAEAGFTKADVLGRMPHFSADQGLCDWPGMRDLSSQFGVAIANLGTYPGQFFTAETEAQRQAELARLKATVEAAVYFSARSIRVMPGRGADAATVEQVTPYFIEGAAYAAQRGIYLGMETMRALSRESRSWLCACARTSTRRISECYMSHATCCSEE